MQTTEIFKTIDDTAGQYRLGFFWFWNDELENSALEDKVRQFAAAKIDRLVLHPIHGMTVEYMSEEYLAKVRFALECCRQARIRVWLYDEFGWPSGNAGGELLRRYPECKGWHLYFDRRPDGSILAEPRRTEIVLDNTTGAPWCRMESGYLDTLSEDAVGRFIELTHQRLYDAIGVELWRAVVLGFFTDEVAAMLESAGRNGVWLAEALPWTPQLPEVFFDRYHFRIEEHYAELADPQEVELRRKYWEVATAMFIGHFYRAIRLWCEAHDVLFTGHMGDDVPLQQSRFSGNIFQALAELHIPGWDYLGNRDPVNARCVFEMASVSSAAKAQGKDRIFCEIFGVSPQNTTWIEMLKKIQLFSFYHINMLYLMGAHQSLKGLRKHLYWPPYFTESTIFSQFADFKRLAEKSLALVGGLKPVKRFAILYPQDQLEQMPVIGCSPYLDPTRDRLLEVIGIIQEHQENFDFVYKEALKPELLQEYETVFALRDFLLYPETEALLEPHRIVKLNCAELKAMLDAEPKSFARYLAIGDDSRSARVFRFELADGALFAIHNAAQSLRTFAVEAGAGFRVTRLNLAEDRFEMVGPTLELDAESNAYLVVSPVEAAGSGSGKPVLKKLALQYEKNTAILTDVEFSRGGADQSWRGESNHVSIPGHRLPGCFQKETSAHFRGKVNCLDAVGVVNVVFEADYLAGLAVDGVALDLTGSRPVTAWDRSCRAVDVVLGPGVHIFTGEMKIPAFESSMKNDGFFAVPPMPSLDLALEGDFFYQNGALTRNSTPRLDFPLDLAQLGFPYSRNPIWVELELAAEDDDTEVVVSLLPGTSANVMFRGNRYFVYDLLWTLPVKLMPGLNKLEIELLPSNGQFFGCGQEPWGIREIRFER